MNAHTTGRLTFGESGDANKYTIIDDRHHWLISALHNGEHLVHTQRENLRRLCACWNACQSVSTEDLERYYNTGGGIDEALQEASLRSHVLAVQQRDELLKTLRHIELAAMDISCERAAIRDAARAAIASAAGTREAR